MQISSLHTFRLCVLLCLALVVRPCWGQIPPEIEKAYVQANMSLEAKDFKTADQTLKDAADSLKKLPDDDRYPPKQELQASLLLRRGQVLMHDEYGAKDLAESLQIFEAIANSEQLGNAKQKAVAQINAAAVLMRLKRPGEAAQLMEQCDWDAIEPGQRHLMFYNYGRALEESGKPTEAMRRYARSLASDPNFELAQQKLESLLREYIFGQTPQPANLFKQLIDEGAADLMLTMSTEALVRESSLTPQVQRLLSVLTASMARAFENQEQFLAKHQNSLNLLADSHWKDFANEVLLLTSEKFAVVSLEKGFESKAFEFTLPSLPWCSQRRLQETLSRPMSDLLKKTAQPYLNQPTKAVKSDNPSSSDWIEDQQAFVRIYSAWLLNPSDLELGRLLAYVTQKASKSDLLRRAARDRLVDSMIHLKGETYRLNGKTIEDWQNILLMHTVLGTVFEADNQCDEKHGIRSGVAQWRYAINAEKMVRKLQKEKQLKDDELYLAPGLHEHLAMCLQATNRREEALDSFIDAGKGYVSLDNIQAAQRMCDAATKLPPESDAARAKLDSLRTAIEAAEQR